MSWSPPKAAKVEQQDRVWTRGRWSITVTTGYPSQHAPVHLRVAWGGWDVSASAAGLTVSEAAKDLTDTLLSAGWPAAAEVLAEALAGLEVEP